MCRMEIDLLFLFLQVIDITLDVQEGGRVIGYSRRKLDDIIAVGEEGGWLELFNSR